MNYDNVKKRILQLRSSKFWVRVLNLVLQFAYICFFDKSSSQKVK